MTRLVFLIILVIFVTIESKKIICWGPQFNSSLQNKPRVIDTNLPEENILEIALEETNDNIYVETENSYYYASLSNTNGFQEIDMSGVSGSPEIHSRTPCHDDYLYLTTKDDRLFRGSFFFF